MRSDRQTSVPLQFECPQVAPLSLRLGRPRALVAPAVQYSTHASADSTTAERERHTSHHMSAPMRSPKRSISSAAIVVIRSESDQIRSDACAIASRWSDQSRAERQHISRVGILAHLYCARRLSAPLFISVIMFCAHQNISGAGVQSQSTEAVLYSTAEEYSHTSQLLVITAINLPDDNTLSAVNSREQHGAVLYSYAFSSRQFQTRRL